MRSTGAAVGVVAVALAISAVALVNVLQHSVRAYSVAAATTRAQDVAAQLLDGTAAADLSLQPGPGESAVVQILDHGRVVAASSGVGGKPALSRAEPAGGHSVASQVNTLPAGIDVDGRAHTILALGVSNVRGADTVVVAQSIGLGEDTVSEVTTLLAISCPLLVLIVGAVTYVLAGRALSPVEAIRRRTAGISSADMSARVPVPATGDEVARLAETMNEMLARLDAS